MRKTSGLCPKLGSKWSSSWAVAPLAIVGPGLCSTWRRPPTPGCRTLCPLTWTSGGRSSSWPGSRTAPSCLVRNAAVQGSALPRGRPLARRRPWRPVLPPRQAALHPKSGQEPATPEVPAFGLLHLLSPWTSCATLPGAESDLNSAHCAQGPAPAAGREEL